MKVIKCNFCQHDLEQDQNRFIARVQEANNENRSVIRFIVLEKDDFCSIDCLFEMIKNRMSEAGELH